MSYSGSCVTVDLKLATMANKATSYGFRLRSSKSNSRANVYCVLVPIYLYTHTINSYQLWSLKLVAMVTHYILLQQTTTVWDTINGKCPLAHF